MGNSDETHIDTLYCNNMVVLVYDIPIPQPTVDTHSVKLKWFNSAHVGCGSMVNNLSVTPAN